MSMDSAKDRLDLLSDDELERLLDTRDRMERFARGGALANHERFMAHSLKWMHKAVELIEAQPARLFQIRAVANDVALWCAENDITKKNGNLYTPSTIYRHLLDHREGITASLQKVRTHRVGT